MGTYMVDVGPGTLPPQVAPATGTYHASFDATLALGAADPSEVACYTLDGTTPSCSATCGSTAPATCTGGSKTYDPKAEIVVDSTVTDPKTGRVRLWAITCQAGSDYGVGLPVDYTLQVDPVGIAPAAGTPVPAGGTLSGVQITESGASGDQPYAFICWSTDGTTVPDCTCSGATPENTASTVGPGLYKSTGNATPVMQVQRAAGAGGIAVRAVACATGYAQSDAPYASITWQ